MDNNAAQANSIPAYPREIYEPVLATSMELDEFMRQDFTISYFDLEGDHEVHACYGDIKKTIDALMDYTSMLDTIREQWKLEGYHRAMYEYHSDILRKFAGKLQAAIGYDYAATLEKCRKKQMRKTKDDDIGADGISLAARHRRAPDKKGTEGGKASNLKHSGDREFSDGDTKEADPSKDDSENREFPHNGAERAGNAPPETERHDASGSGSASLNPPTTETAPPSGTNGAPSPPEYSYKVSLGQLEGGTPMERNELRAALEGHLDTLKRNLAVVSLDELKTKYRKPFEELQHNISTTATAYVKQATLEGLRIRSDFLDEALPIIQSTIDQSGLLHQISEAAFRKQDIDEFDRLALELKGQIDQALVPFHHKHTRLYMEKTPPGIQPKAAEFYNEATGCIWRDGAWTPMKVDSTAVLLPIQDIPKKAA